MDEKKTNILTRITENICQKEIKSNLFLINGAPATGKTRLLSNLVESITKTCPKKRILILTPNETVANVLTEKLIDIKRRQHDDSTLRFVYFNKNNDEDIDYRVYPYTLEGLVYLNICEKIKKKADTNKHDIFKLKRSNLYRKRNMLEHEIRKYPAKIIQNKKEIQRLNKEIYEWEQQAYKDEALSVIKSKEKEILIRNANIVISSISNCTDIQYICKSNFDICIVDDAESIEETDFVKVFVHKFDTLILAGDITPKIKIGENTLFKRMSDMAWTLVEQYRMEPSILDFPNKVFYEEQIQTNIQPDLRCLFNKIFCPYFVFELEKKDVITHIIQLVNEMIAHISVELFSTAILTFNEEDLQLVVARTS